MTAISIGNPNGYDGLASSWLKGRGGGTGSNGLYYAESKNNRESRRNYAIWWMRKGRGARIAGSAAAAFIAPGGSESATWRCRDGVRLWCGAGAAAATAVSGSWRTIPSSRGA